MTRFKEGARRFPPAIAAVALVAFTGACSQQDASRVTAPVPADPPIVTRMHWMWEPASLAAEVSRAGSNPLVQRALAQAGIPGMSARHDLAIRAIGVGPDGAPVGFTLLPYSILDDATRAVFISSVQGLGTEGVEIVEMIAGREPRANEVGFEPVMFGGRLVFIHTIDSYVPAPVDPYGPHPVNLGAESPVRRSAVSLFACLAERMPQGCAAGAAIADRLASGIPRAEAVGCGIGAAVGAGSCAVDFIRNK